MQSNAYKPAHGGRFAFPLVIPVQPPRNAVIVGAPRIIPRVDPARLRVTLHAARGCSAVDCPALSTDRTCERCTY